MIDYIIGLLFFPFSILIFLNPFGITNMEKIIGILIVFIAAIGLIIVQVFNILSALISIKNLLKCLGYYVA